MSISLPLRYQGIFAELYRRFGVSSDKNIRLAQYGFPSFSKTGERRQQLVPRNSPCSEDFPHTASICKLVEEKCRKTRERLKHIPLDEHVT